eukprot:TRINITY_DN16145_c0_g1_i1.p1 TRINITY_DN16145_c0_g1~~TRINITY_DN16145_c0_g1_i1.p1  ORF type:complete len:152 (+),score=44.62 TRINITY_DN16145_c0_g1_i1:8-463(+)
MADERASETRRKVARGNLFAAVPDHLLDEVFSSLLEMQTEKGGKVLIERIVSRQHSSPEGFWYDQKQTEWVMVVRGSAILEIQHDAGVLGKNPEEEVEEGQEKEIEKIDLGPGDYVHIPPHLPHRVSATDALSDTIWLAIHVFPSDLPSAP